MFYSTGPRTNKTTDKLKLTGQTWAEFSILEVAMCMQYTHLAIEQNCQT
jgi:hypothetical protein